MTAGAAYPTSLAQQRLWFVEQLVPGTAQHNLALRLDVSGALDLTRLAEAVRAVVRRHEALRTRFGVVDGTPVQVVLDDVDVPVQVVAAEDLAPLLRRPFDVSRAPLLRVLWAAGGRDNAGIGGTLAFVLHHLVVDGWSIGLFLAEVSALYPLRSGPAELAELPWQYVDYALWQRELATSPEVTGYLRDHVAELAGYPLLVELPYDRPRPPVQTFAGGMVEFEVPPEVHSRLLRLANDRGATAYMVLLSAFAVVLGRWSGQTRMLVGSPVANRPRPDTEPLIGLFVNTVAVPTDLTGDPTFAELVARVRDRCLATFARQDVPFEILVNALSPERSLAYNPLVQVMFALQNAPAPRLTLPGTVIQPQDVDTGTAQFDLLVNLTPRPDGGLAGLVQYASDLFDAGTARRFADHLGNVLASVAGDAGQRVSAVAMVGTAEAAQVAAWGNGRHTDPGPETVGQRIWAMAAAHPDRAAVADATGGWTYRELVERASQIAAALGRAGAGPGALVGLCLPAGRDLVAGLLGVWAAGGAYVPLDPGYPAARLAYVAEHSRLDALLTTGPLAGLVPLPPGTQVILVDRLPAGHEPAGPWPAPGAGPHDLAYVIYTSGSTGQPKGVMVEQHNLTNVVTSFAADPGFTAADRMLSVTSLSFDIAALELLLPLTAGGHLTVAPAGAGGDPELLHRLVVEHQVTHVQATPSTWRLYASYATVAPPTLRHIWCGGEELTRQLAGELLALRIGVHNVYGPTETTIWSTHGGVVAAGGPVPLGRPIANTQLSIVDSAGYPTGTGIPGELCIRGAGVTRGYLHRPDLTAVAYTEGGRTYRTGDRVRWDAGGRLLYHGRLDDQLKIRGHRIEPGEIDATVGGHPRVQDACTIAQLAPSGGTELTTYVTPRTGPGTDPAVDAGAVTTWGTVWDQIYAAGDPPDEGDLNLKGWVSSYTKRELPVEEMRHWVESTVDTIAATGAHRILEVGCGTGLLLLRLAAGRDRYVGVDLSRAALAHVAAEVAGRGLDDRVRLELAAATEVAGLVGAERFDCVVLNSVVQYFPSGDYLSTVLTDLVGLVRPGGYVFVGDVRNLRLAAAFQASVLDGGTDLPPDGLAVLAAQRAREEDELLVDPGHFTGLARQVPAITGIRIAIKPPGPDTEMSRFRYDVLLRVGGPAEEEADAVALDWGVDVGSLDRLAELLATAHSDLVIDNIPNSRVARFVRLVRPGADGPPGEPLSPEAIAEVAVRAGWGVHHGLSFAGADEGRLRTVLRRDGRAGFVDTRLPYREPSTNDLRNAGLLRTLPNDVRGWLRERLPEYMVPARVVALPGLPQTPNGKVDRGALRQLTRDRAAPPTEFVAPSTERQHQLHEIWCHVLNVPRVGVTENIFDAGATSLLVVRARHELRDQHGLVVPMTAFFAYPTIAALAAHLADGGPPGAGADRTADSGSRRRRHGTAERRRTSHGARR